MFVDVPAISVGGGLLPCLQERQLLKLDKCVEQFKHENGNVKTQ